MALPKLYQRIRWWNNQEPAINDENLNKMDKAIDDIDDRVISLGGDVLEVIPQIQTLLAQAEDLVEEVEQYSGNPPYIGENGDWYTWSSVIGDYIDSGIDASITVAIADVTMLAPDATPYVTNTGTDTDPVFHLFVPRGNGITSIAKTGTSGLVDTYTITYSDGYTTTFTVTNGGGMTTDGSTAADHVRFSNSSFTVGNYTTPLGENSVRFGNTRASGRYSYAQGFYPGARGDYSHAEGVSGSSRAKAAINKDYGGIMDQGDQEVDVILGLDGTEVIGFYVDGTSAYQGTINNVPSGVVRVNTANYQVSLDIISNQGKKDIYVTAAALQAITSDSTKVHVKLTMQAWNLNALGEGSHSEGLDSFAVGAYSHSEGAYTNAQANYQHVGGWYNDNKADTLFELGNGTENTRNNAFEVYKDGSLSTDNGVTKVKLQDLAMVKLETQVTLSTSADVTASFSDARITADSVIDVYTSDPNLSYKTMSISSGSCTVTFAQQSSASTITVRIYIK